MKSFFFLLSLSISLFLVAERVRADELMESYVARLSATDHFNSEGDRLNSPALIIRQDRANFHKYHERDSEDEGDSYFSNAHNREVLQRLLERGRTSKSVYRTIVNGTPLIKVDIYRSGGGDYINVTIISD